MSEPRDYLLSAQQLAAETTLDESTLASWRAKGKGPAYFHLGNRVVYRRSVVDAWIAQQEQAA